jgi:hypothetical protein
MPPCEEPSHTLRRFNHGHGSMPLKFFELVLTNPRNQNTNEWFSSMSSHGLQREKATFLQPSKISGTTMPQGIAIWQSLSVDLPLPG